MIHIRDIQKKFNDEPVLRGVTLDVIEKETMVILGKSGGGKSVLLKLIIGLLPPDSGTIDVDGQEVTQLDYRSLRALREKFGFLFQSAALFDSMTVGENVALPLRRRTDENRDTQEERVRKALTLVGLENAENQMPAALSGGMRKRVGLARAIVLTPPYILYDEPTTGLDVETADGINVLINDLRSRLGVTSIVVTHDIRSAFVVGDRFAILDQGKILTKGTAQEIQNSTDEEVRKYISSSLPSPGVQTP